MKNKEDRLREKQCGSKVAYCSLKEASDAMWANKRHGFMLGEKTRPYKCQWCDYYHIGHYIKVININKQND